MKIVEYHYSAYAQRCSGLNVNKGHLIGTKASKHKFAERIENTAIGELYLTVELHLNDFEPRRTELMSQHRGQNNFIGRTISSGTCVASFPAAAEY